MMTSLWACKKLQCLSAQCEWIWGKLREIPESRNHCSVTADPPVTFFPTSDSQSNMGSWVNMDLADLLECSICLEQVHNILNCILWCAKKILFCHVYDLKTKRVNKYFCLAGRVKQGSSVPTHLLHQMSEGTMLKTMFIVHNMETTSYSNNF